MEMLALQAGPQAEGHAAAAARGEILTGPAPGIRNKTLFGEFVVCQVKTMSLLAFLLRNPNDALKTFRQQIPEYVVRLLKDCPPELSAARKVGQISISADLSGTPCRH
jgi:transformation/transcription domain-associated protein